MSELHDPKSCPLCKGQAAELRHPVYRRLRPLLVLPAPRGGAA
ncbi:hypothetical protein [Streptomyces niveus]|nr:hypothetical protein [Streptomyces niveus]EST22816.1 hypothetical protein M877_28995 [Streptomyces niveus NCIMB 11891]